MPATDVLIAQQQTELDERRAFQEQLTAAAAEEGRDLNPQEMELYMRATDRMAVLADQLAPLREGARIANESRAAHAALVASMQGRPLLGQSPFGPVEYRSAGQYITDLYYAAVGDAQAQGRLDQYNRAAAHQITSENPGLLPQQVVMPVVNFVDTGRPLVTAIGAEDLGPGTWAYPKVTQHTLVGPQAAEKAELPSRVLKVTMTPITAPTYGGYVNISKQNIARTSSAIIDMVLNDLAGQYAIETEEAAGTDITAAATAGPALPAAPTPVDVNKAIWTAAGLVFAATKGQGRLIVAVSPDMLGLVGPLFAPINPQNAFGAGFSAAGFAQGPVGQISQVVVVMSAGLAAGTIIVMSSAAARPFEYRYGNMQVGEPSVWGVQVGYAGDFETVIVEAGGIVEITVTP